jgi:hypothetical protein
MTVASKMKNKDDKVFLRMKRETVKEGYALNIGHMYVLRLLGRVPSQC